MNVTNFTMNKVIDLIKKGNLLKVQQFYDEYLFDFDNYLFSIACEYGHLKLGKWILEVNPTINVSKHDNYAFCVSCRNGHLKVAKWLFSLDPTINIRAYNEYIFREACMNGRLKIAKWLLRIKPEIYVPVCDNYVFYNACKYNYLELAQWLTTIVDIYKINIVDGKIVDYYVLQKIRINTSKKIDLGTIEEYKKECPICYENTVSVQTGCKHNFCKDCIQTVYNTKKNCPCCRESLNLFYLIE